MSRFAPDPNKPLGTCMVCQAELGTQEAIDEHLLAFKHKVLVTNRSRAMRIEDAVATVVDKHIEACIDELDLLMAVERLSEREILLALSQFPDIEAAWAATLPGGEQP